ncbi:MAG TPA: hypothetical protein VF291_00155 [Burkholderiaceae bacterium]
MSLRRGVGWAAALAALALVFALYLRPDMVMSVATQLWNCF